VNWKYRVPGRIELVGKHTDYAGGPSLTCATPFHMHAAVQPHGEPVVRVHDQRSRTTAQVALAADAPMDASRWSVYLAAAARRVARDFPDARCGVEVTLNSTIPTAMGMSSSSALVVTLVMALFDANDLWSIPTWRGVADDELAFAQYCAAVESGAAWGPYGGDTGVGTRGGAQDHIAICASQNSAVGEYTYLPGRVVQRVAWPSEWRIVVATSGVKATKTGNALHAYNRVADSVRTLVAAWNVSTGRGEATLAEVLASAPDAYEHVMSLADRAASSGVSAEYLRGRVRQYREETTVIVPGMMAAIARADSAEAARLMAWSQEMADTLLQNQVPQTSWLAANARAFGAAGATAFGAGFGGAVWALVAEGDAERCAADWMAAFAAQPGAGNMRLEPARVVVPADGATRASYE
jgi:galactokinase